MYKLHLILKYLRKRRIAWVSLIAVTLCTAMVIVVISVMGGWLRMFRESFHGLTGDIIVHGELQGFPHYQDMIDRIVALPDVKPGGAVPTIDTFGLTNIRNIARRGVQVVGYPIDKIGAVNNFPKSLYRQYQQYLDAADDTTNRLTREQREQLRLRAEQNAAAPSFALLPDAAMYREILPNSVKDPAAFDGMIAGLGVLGIRKDQDGNWSRRDGIYGAWVRLTVLGIDATRASPDVMGGKQDRMYWIVDDSRTQIWQNDSSTVYVPFEVLQRDLGMDGRTEIDADTKEKHVIPARTSAIQVAAKPGVDLFKLKEEIQKVVNDVSAERRIGAGYPITVETWEESQATFIAAIEKEKM
ncbi:MAG: hypothetical protein ACREJC_02090, partial [Tepidisphaeraceae bacterium]